MKILNETLELVPVRSLKVHPKNPRKGNEAAILESLEANGWWGALVVQRSTSRVLAGNHRLLAARKAKAKEVPVLYVDVDDAAALRILLADNRTADLASYDDRALSGLLVELLEGTGKLDGTGYTPATLDKLLASLGEDPLEGAEDPGPELERAEELRAKWGTELGQCWDIPSASVPGNVHRIACADSTSEAVVRALLGDVVPDCILTDPPYCSGGFQESGRSKGSVGTDAAHKQVANDRLSTRGYQALLKQAFTHSGAPFLYAFTDWRMWVWLFDIAESCGFGVRSMIVWDKGTPGMGRGWRAQHELILWACKAQPPFENFASGAGNVVGDKRTGNHHHTTEKPATLLGVLLANTPFVQTVYDPFLGSGTTIIAAEQERRTGYGLELDPSYLAVALERLSELGLTPRRVG